MFPNRKESVMLALLLILVQTMLSIYLVKLGVRWEAGNPTIYLLISLLSTALMLWFSLPKMHLKFSQLFHANTNSISQLILMTTIPITLVIIGSQVLISNYLNAHYSFFPSDTTLSQHLEALANSGFLGFVSICIVAPVTEELVFRGVILRGLLSNIKEKQAILFSSILFSLVHINPDQLVYTLVFGYFLGWLYVRTYSLWPSILAHVLFNLTGFLLVGYDIEIKGINYFPNDEIVYPSAMLQILSVTALFAGIYLLNNLFEPQKSKE